MSKEYDNTAIGWVNQRESKDGRTKYLTIKFSAAADGLVLREGVQFACFRQEGKGDLPPYYMIVVDNDVYAELRLDGAGDHTAPPPQKTKDGEGFDYEDDDLF